MADAAHAAASPNLATARRDFVDLWGQMANHWGINRTMAQIHALLMISHEPLTADQIMDELQISRGNVSMNLRDLINWGIVRRTSIAGDRRDFFTTETDVWSMFQIILRERKKRELDPLVTRLDECLNHAGKKPEHGAAPEEKAAGVELHVKIGSDVQAGEPLCTVYAEAAGELAYAFDYVAVNDDIFVLGET